MTPTDEHRSRTRVVRPASPAPDDKSDASDGPVTLDPPVGSVLVAHDLSATADEDVVAPGLLRVFYPRAVNSVSGEPGVGKSWLMVAAVLRMLLDGGSAIVIDFEDSAAMWRSRLLALGADATSLVDVLYLGAQGAPSAADVAWLARLIESVSTDVVVVVDSVAEALAAAGLDEDKAGEVTAWHRAFPRPLADAGGTVLVTEHVTKAAQGRGRWARGSGAKLAAITGTALGFEIVESFSRERSGTATLVVAKDRRGSVGAVGEVVADVRFDVAGGSLHRVSVTRSTLGPSPAAAAVARGSEW